MERGPTDPRLPPSPIQPGWGILLTVSCSWRVEKKPKPFSFKSPQFFLPDSRNESFMGEIRHTGSQGGPWVASTRRTWVSSNTSPPLNPPRWGWLRAASPRSPPQLLPRPGAAPLGAAQAAASPARTALLPHFLQPRRPRKRKRKACREPIPAIHPLGPAELPPALRDAGLPLNFNGL